MTTYTTEEIIAMTPEQRDANLITLKTELANYIDGLSDADVIKASRIIMKAILTNAGSFSNANTLATALKTQVGDY